jgi:hypothetical protein
MASGKYPLSLVSAVARSVSRSIVPAQRLERVGLIRRCVTSFPSVRHVHTSDHKGNTNRHNNNIEHDLDTKIHDVVIIGGGVLGASVGYHLMRLNSNYRENFTIRNSNARTPPPYNVLLLDQAPSFASGATAKTAGIVLAEATGKEMADQTLKDIQVLNDTFSEEVTFRQMGSVLVQPDGEGDADGEPTVDVENLRGGESDANRILTQLKESLYGDGSRDPGNRGDANSSGDTNINNSSDANACSNIKLSKFVSDSGVVDAHQLTYGYLAAAKKLGNFEDFTARKQHRASAGFGAQFACRPNTHVQGMSVIYGKDLEKINPEINRGNIHNEEWEGTFLYMNGSNADRRPVIALHTIDRSSDWKDFAPNRSEDSENGNTVNQRRIILARRVINMTGHQFSQFGDNLVAEGFEPVGFGETGNNNIRLMNRSVDDPFVKLRSHFWCLRRNEKEISTAAGVDPTPVPLLLFPGGYMKVLGKELEIGIQEKESFVIPQTGNGGGNGNSSNTVQTDDHDRVPDAPIDLFLEQYDMLKTVFPKIDEYEVSGYVCGITTYTPDGLPVAEKFRWTPPTENIEAGDTDDFELDVISLSGCNGYGVTWAGGLGRAVAQEAFGGDNFKRWCHSPKADFSNQKWDSGVKDGIADSTFATSIADFDVSRFAAIRREDFPRLSIKRRSEKFRKKKNSGG